MVQCAHAGDLGSISIRFPGEGNGNSPVVFLFGKFHGRDNLTGYSPVGYKESDVMN